MGIIQGGNNSAAYSRVASAGTDVHSSREDSDKPRLVFSSEQDALTAVPSWEYCDYT